MDSLLNHEGLDVSSVHCKVAEDVKGYGSDLFALFKDALLQDRYSISFDQ